MTQLAMDIPEPSSDDAESVVTALEMAAVFDAQGDAQEALRWVRRAAEAASDEGNDLRALMLARSVADLTTHLQSFPPGAPASARITIDPSASRADGPPAPAATASSSLPPGSTESEQTLQAPAPSDTELGYGAPGEDGVAPSSSGEAPDTLDGGPPTQGTSPNADGDSDPTPTPRASAAQAAMVEHAWDDPVISAHETDQNLSRSPEPGVSPEQSSDRALGGDAESEKSDPAWAEANTATVGTRRAMRVSIAPYPGAPGFFVVRPLEDHQIPGQGAQEALVVFLGPKSSASQ